MEALVHIKERNIIHRDIKPHNILVEKSTLDPKLVKVRAEFIFETRLLNKKQFLFFKFENRKITQTMYFL